MTTGQTRYADITSLVDPVREDALYVARQLNLLVPTVRVFTDTSGMSPRKNSIYGSLGVRAVGEGEDVTPTLFERSDLSTLTPGRYADMVFLTDQRVNTDGQNILADAAMEMGAAVAQSVDEAIAAEFGNLTGGTIGSAGGTITWGSIAAARALAHGQKIPGPYWCVLHPYQWLHLFDSAATTGAEISNAPQFQDRLVSNFFISSLFGDVLFAVTPSVEIDGSDDATGAFYNQLALAYDERRPFNVRGERDESREGMELNYSIWYATGVWRPAFGIQLIGDASTPS